MRKNKLDLQQVSYFMFDQDTKVIYFAQISSQLHLTSPNNIRSLIK